MKNLHWQPWERNDGETRSYTCEGTDGDDPILIHVDETTTPNVWATIVYQGDNAVIASESGFHTSRATDAQRWARAVARAAAGAR